MPILAQINVLIMSATTPLFRLPQEIKDQIYKLLLPQNQTIHILTREKEGLLHYICHEPAVRKTSKIRAERAERRFTFNPLSHETCFIHFNELWKTYSSRPALGLRCLQTCRQMYEEASLALMKINMIVFEDAGAMFESIVRTPAVLEIRKLHLHIYFSRSTKWESWGIAIREIGNKMKHVQELYLLIDQNDDARTFDAAMKDGDEITRDIMSLAQLPLVEVKVRHIERWETFPGWTSFELQRWERYVENMLLRQGHHPTQCPR